MPRYDRTPCPSACAEEGQTDAPHLGQGQQCGAYAPPARRCRWHACSMLHTHCKCTACAHAHATCACAYARTSSTAVPMAWCRSCGAAHSRPSSLSSSLAASTWLGLGLGQESWSWSDLVRVRVGIDGGEHLLEAREPARTVQGGHLLGVGASTVRAHAGHDTAMAMAQALQSHCGDLLGHARCVHALHDDGMALNGVRAWRGDGMRGVG